MTEPERHIMQLIGSHEDVEQWQCPVCGREFLMTWPPNYHRTILKAGEENVVHVGGKSFAEAENLLHLELGGASIDTNDAQRNDPRLDVFDEWLKGREK